MLRFITVIFVVVTGNLFAQGSDEFFTQRTKIGGYGELHFNYSKPESGDVSKKLDFHRFVIFFGHSFSEAWSFQSEVELEHNLVGEDKGELELEQAYINFTPLEYLGIRAGVILNPVGLINETHEPPTFFGVERPDYQKYLIPTTWFGNGASIFGYYKGFDFAVTLMEGLNGDKLTTANIYKQGIRSGRNGGFESDARSMLIGARINYSGINGVLLGASYSNNNSIGDSISTKVGLFEVHTKLNWKNIYAVGEFGNISYSDSEIQKSFGYYIDLGSNIGTFFRWKTKVIPFIRYTNYNTAASTIYGGDSEKAANISKIMIGLNILPIENVVVKFDYAKKTVELNNLKTDLFNFGIGYMF